jgi:molecular chaperone GrpE
MNGQQLYQAKICQSVLIATFCPLFLLGKIIDYLTFVPIFKDMNMEDMNYSADPSAQNAGDNGPDALDDLNTDENIAGTAHLNSDLAGSDEELDRLKEELQAQKDKYLRLVAEFDNFRKRSARESLETRQTAGKEIIISLLDVLDDCDRAERQLQTADNIDQVKEGIQLVFSKLRSILQGKGLRAMQSVNTDFDVEKHEAITEIPVQDPSLKGKVIDEVQKGYYLNDKIIRFAKVVVGK